MKYTIDWWLDLALAIFGPESDATKVLVDAGEKGGYGTEVDIEAPEFLMSLVMADKQWRTKCQHN